MVNQVGLNVAIRGSFKDKGPRVVIPAMVCDDARMVTQLSQNSVLDLHPILATIICIHFQSESIVSEMWIGRHCLTATLELGSRNSSRSHYTSAFGRAFETVPGRARRVAVGAYARLRPSSFILCPLIIHPHNASN